MSGQHKRRNIVVVEDDEMFSMFLTHYLRNNMGDINVNVCASGEEGVQTILATEPDAVILDYYLDDMTGLEILRKVKAQLPNLIVIVLSAQKKIDTAVELLKEGANAYISKSPDSALELMQSLEAAFQKRERKDDSLSLSMNVSKKNIVKIVLFVFLGLLILLVLLSVISSMF